MMRNENKTRSNGSRGQGDTPIKRDCVTLQVAAVAYLIPRKIAFPNERTLPPPHRWIERRNKRQEARTAVERRGGEESRISGSEQNVRAAKKVVVV